MNTANLGNVTDGRCRQIEVSNRTSGNTKCVRRRKRKFVSLFRAFCNTVGLVTIMVSLVFVLIYAFGKFYEWLVPIFDKLMTTFLDNGFSIVLSLTLIAVLTYLVDHLIRSMK